MFPKSGRKLPKWPTRPTSQEFSQLIGAALRIELGSSRRAAKTIMRWTGASDRSARNWLNGLGGPTGWHLVLLARESSEVMATILALANRDGLMLGSDLRAVRTSLRQMTGLLTEMIGSDAD